MAPSVSAAETSAGLVTPRETCDDCGFDSMRWSRQDAIRTVEKAEWLTALAVERLPDGVWLTRPDRSMPAIGEHVDHLASVMATWLMRAEFLVDAPGIDVAESPEQPIIGDGANFDRANSLEALRVMASRHGAYLRSVDEATWANAITVGGESFSLDWGVRHSAHEVMHHLWAIAGVRQRLGDVLTLGGGTVASLHASGGGVPKPEIPSAEIDVGGVVGDAQAARQYHGRPWQALCLWSTEVVEAWAAEGHPIFPGAAGENLSLSGLDWSQIRAGLIVQVGDVTARISAPAVPCTKNSRWFSDRDHRRLGHDVSPGRARWYASVLTPGRVEPGDPVSVHSGG